MEGWIKLHRSIQEHWIWQDPVKLKWWIDILISVNHKDAKINIGNEIYECKRGQSIKSLNTWAIDWKTSKDTVKNFFNLLEKDKMITRENLLISTRLTVCNYVTYQDDLHDCLTPDLRLPYACLTPAFPNNNVKNVNKEKNIYSAVGEEKKPKSKRKDKDTVPTHFTDLNGTTFALSDFLSYFNSHCGKIPKILNFNNGRAAALDKILKTYTKQNLIQVVIKACESDFLQGRTSTGWVADINWLLKPERFLEILEGKYDNKVQSKQIPKDPVGPTVIPKDTKGPTQIPRDPVGQKQIPKDVKEIPIREPFD